MGKCDESICWLWVVSLVLDPHLGGWFDLFFRSRIFSRAPDSEPRRLKLQAFPHTCVFIPPTIQERYYFPLYSWLYIYLCVCIYIYIHNYKHFCIYQSVTSVAQSCLTLYNPMDCSTPDLPVHHQLLEFTQTHVH